ncbi:MAG: tyrosine-type recombinase/integrase [Cellulosilyticaceae bacterium]
MKIEKAIQSFILSLSYNQLSEHTIRAYRQDLMQWAALNECLDLKNLNYEMIENYLHELFNKQLSPNTLRRKRVVLHRFLKFCFDKQFVNQPLHQLIDTIKTKKHQKPKEILTSQEIQRMFVYFEQEISDKNNSLTDKISYAYSYYCIVRNLLLVKILLYTGCRAQEVVSLRKDAINYENKTIQLITKGNKYNIIPMHDELFEAFNIYEKQMERLKEIDSNNLSYIISNSVFLFPSRVNSNEHLSSRTLHDLMKQLGKCLDRHLHAHIFRHTFASYCIAAHMDISTVSSLISHSNPAITLSIYTHEIESSQKQREIQKLKFHDLTV